MIKPLPKYMQAKLHISKYSCALIKPFKHFESQDRECDTDIFQKRSIDKIAIIWLFADCSKISIFAAFFLLPLRTYSVNYFHPFLLILYIFAQRKATKFITTSCTSKYDNNIYMSSITTYVINVETNNNYLKKNKGVKIKRTYIPSTKSWSNSYPGLNKDFSIVACPDECKE